MNIRKQVEVESKKNNDSLDSLLSYETLVSVKKKYLWKRKRKRRKK